jgi:hypothetical protein
MSNQNYRITEQAYETVRKTNAKSGDLIQPFNYKKIDNGICPTITTRPEGLKTMILIVEEADK